VEWLCLNRLASVPCSHASAVCSRREREVSEFLTLQQTADLAGVKAEQIRVRIERGELTPETLGTSITTRETTYLFSEADVVRLKTLMFAPRQKNGNEPFVDDGSPISPWRRSPRAIWQLSTDTIQRLLQDEPGVVTLGNKNPRGKRKRVMLRIPREVMERVKRRRSNT
jgi:hypothetical protein